jgi:hypothetical protein
MAGGVLSLVSLLSLFACLDEALVLPLNGGLFSLLDGVLIPVWIKQGIYIQNKTAVG